MFDRIDFLQFACLLCFVTYCKHLCQLLADLRFLTNTHSSAFMRFAHFICCLLSWKCSCNIVPDLLLVICSYSLNLPDCFVALLHNLLAFACLPSSFLSCKDYCNLLACFLTSYHIHPLIYLVLLCLLGSFVLTWFFRANLVLSCLLSCMHFAIRLVDFRQ